MSGDARSWLGAVEAALVDPRLDRLEALRRDLPALEALTSEGPAIARVVSRLATLAGRRPDHATADRLGWWLDALLLQRVIAVPRSRSRALMPALFVSLAVLLGLVLGRVVAASVMAAGLVVWAMRAGGSVRERHGDWLRLGDTIFDLRHARAEPLGDDWYLLEGHKVPASVLRELGVVPARR